MLWRCFSLQGSGKLIKVVGRMDKCNPRKELYRFLKPEMLHWGTHYILLKKETNTKQQSISEGHYFCPEEKCRVLQPHLEST